MNVMTTVSRNNLQIFIEFNVMIADSSITFIHYRIVRTKVTLQFDIFYDNPNDEQTLYNVKENLTKSVGFDDRSSAPSFRNKKAIN